MTKKKEKLPSLIARSDSIVVTIPITIPVLSIIGIPLNASNSNLAVISTAVTLSFAATTFTDIMSSAFIS
jgi:hypothetical protein